MIASARLDIAQGQWESAKRGLQLVLAKDPRDVDARIAIGMLEESSGQHEAAVKTYRAVLQIDKSHVVAKNNLVVRLSEKPATVDEAVSLALQLKESAPDNPEIDDTVGWVYYRKGDYPLAIRYFERASSLTKDPRAKSGNGRGCAGPNYGAEAAIATLWAAQSFWGCDSWCAKRRNRNTSPSPTTTFRHPSPVIAPRNE